MLINADFNKEAIVTADDYEWISSPQSGVERVMLDRVGEEKARATSIVRYQPESDFPSHMHPEGEEIFVLSGTFSEGKNHYPAGWYLRNPPGSEHRPSSQEGTEIFVKLRQMHPSDQNEVRINTNEPDNWVEFEDRDICQLYNGENEKVSLIRLDASSQVFFMPVAGAELFVINGTIKYRNRYYKKGSWIRLPPGEYQDLRGGLNGALFYLKVGRHQNVTLGY